MGLVKTVEPVGDVGEEQPGSAVLLAGKAEMTGRVGGTGLWPFPNRILRSWELEFNED